jgi:hypothetical protein
VNIVELVVIFVTVELVVMFVLLLPLDVGPVLEVEFV